MTETCQGVLQDVRIYNAASGWGFARLVGQEYKVVGCFPALEPGDYCEFTGEWTEHPKYGKQFKASSVSISVPKDSMGLRKYLQQRLPWIGPVAAGRLVDDYGDRLFDVIQNNPMELISVKGITEERALKIHEAFLSGQKDKDLDIFFATHNLTTGMVARLVERYGDKSKAASTIKADPYLLADDVYGVGFKKADAIALSVGIPKRSPRRIKAGILWLLKDASERAGHCFLPASEMGSLGYKLLEVSRGDLGDPVRELADEDGVIVEGDRIALSELYHAEEEIASALLRLASAPHHAVMRSLSQDTLDSLDDDQRRALTLALESKVSVITGGPGTGKTYTIQRILEALGDRKIALAAPTGKAAKRMEEMTSRPAQTIHRLLEFVPAPAPGFRRNRQNPLDFDCVIIDETSMVDVSLMKAFLRAVDPDMTQLIFVGDVDQLPSVGPGMALRDMIDSEKIPTARLTTLHRQSEKSFIALNARAVNRGEKLILNVENSDFHFIQVEDKDKIPEKITQIVNSVPSQPFGVPLWDIQVLCPQRVGPIGVNALNPLLRPLFNPEGMELSGFGGLYTGDRVIQTRNNYDLGIFNGEIGEVLLRQPEPEGGPEELDYVAVQFPQGIVPYSKLTCSELQPAYALTIHKSQGSEFPCVIVPLHTTNFIMLKRPLLYTAITRAKQLLVLVGSEKAMKVAIKTLDTSNRYTRLKEMLCQEAVNR